MEASPLYRLSPELRNTIYEYVFTSRYAVALQTGSILHALTSTCRQVRHESLAMYCALTRFNAHLEDGPATPLSQWLTVLGPERALRMNQINIWGAADKDMHMLNGTLHGADSTARLLQDGPRGIDHHHESKSSQDSEGVQQSYYTLRPVEGWVCRHGWFLTDVILTLHSMGLGLLGFYVISPAEHALAARPTSEFAIVPLHSAPPGEIFVDPAVERDPLIMQPGLSGRERERFILRLVGRGRTAEASQSDANMVSSPLTREWERRG